MVKIANSGALLKQPIDAWGSEPQVSLQPRAGLGKCVELAFECAYPSAHISSKK